MKAQWSKLFVVTVVFLLIAGACVPAATPPPTPTPVPPTPAPDPAAPVQAWVDAINNGDAEAALALVSDDVKWQGSFEATGKEQLRAVVDWMIGIELKPQIKDCQPQDDRVVCNLTAPDGCKAAFGASSLRSKLVFVFQPDGKVQQASLEPDGEEWAGYWSWLEAEMAWAAANRAEEHAKVGTAPNQREAGSIQIKLCREYGESLKSASAANPLDIVQKYQDAYTRHDVDAAMGLFTDDAKYTWGSYFTTGDKVMIRNWLDYDAALNVQTTANNCKTNGSTATCEWRFVHDCFGAEGAIGAGYDMGGTVVFTVNDGKISEYVLTANPDPEYNQWEEAFFKWLEDSYPMDIGSVVQALHTWKFDREFGERLVKFCKEQAASLKSAAGATPIPSTSAPSSDLGKLAKAYRDAFNRHDADGALALFIDQGFSYFDVEFTAHDQETLRDKLEYDFGLGATLEFPDCDPKGEALRCAELWRNEYCLKAMCGFDVWHNEVTFKPKDGQIQFMSFTASPEDEKACGEAYPKYVAWASANRPEEWKKLNAPAAYDLKGRPLGELTSGVCKAYLDSTKSAPAATPVAAADPLPIIKAYQDAVNQHDVDAVTALFADRAIYLMSGGAVGRDEIREVEDWQAGLNPIPFK